MLFGIRTTSFVSTSSGGPHLVTFVQQPSAEMGPEETGPTSNQNPQEGACLRRMELRGEFVLSLSHCRHDMCKGVTM